MDCNCNNICGGKHITAPKIKHVYGNVLRIAIPLTLRSLVKDGDTMVATDTEFIPSADYPVIVAFLNGKHRYAVAASMDGNVAVIEDNGKIPIGTYDITVECRDDIGRPYRFAQATVLRVVDRTAEADIDAEIEYEARLWYLDAAVFLATTEIGSMSEEIDRKLEDVFGYADYDASNKVIQFYNKDRTSVLTTMDASPFVADGSVADVYIDVARQVLVVVNNADSGGRIFNVPLYLIFNSYYNKEQVEDKIAQAIDGIEVDTSGFMQTVEFTNSAEQGMPMGGVIKYSKTARTALDFIDGVGGVHEVAYGIIYGSTDGRIMGGRGNYGEADLGGAAGHVFLNKDDGLLYTYEDDEWVQVGGSGSGGDYEPPVGGIPKTDLASDVQTSLGKADTALQPAALNGYATTSDVTDAINELVDGAPQALDTLKEIADKLGDEDDAVAALTSALGGKQDTISDLATIRTNSGKGIADMSSNADGTVVTTLVNGDTYTVNLNHEHPQYVESEDLADVATSGSYNDLTDKPVIPEGADLSGYYDKDDVDDLLDGKVDKASGQSLMTDAERTKLQGIAVGATANTGTITGITMNGASKGTSGVVDLGTVITAHQDISGKANASEMSVSTSADQTTITLKTGTSATVINQHQSLTGYAKFVLLADEAAYEALATKDSSTLYLIPES